jgi:hypothetical protein
MCWYLPASMASFGIFQSCFFAAMMLTAFTDARTGKSYMEVAGSRASWAACMSRKLDSCPSRCNCQWRPQEEGRWCRGLALERVVAEQGPVGEQDQAACCEV